MSTKCLLFLKERYSSLPWKRTRYCSPEQYNRPTTPLPPSITPSCVKLNILYVCISSFLCQDVCCLSKRQSFKCVTTVPFLWGRHCCISSFFPGGNNSALTAFVRLGPEPPPWGLYTCLCRCKNKTKPITTTTTTKPYTHTHTQCLPQKRVNMVVI